MKVFTQSVLLTLSLALSFSGVRPIPAFAQADMCGGSTVMCGGTSEPNMSSMSSPSDTGDGGMTSAAGASMVGDSSNAPGMSVQPPAPKPSTYSEADKCQDQADSWYLRCSDTLGADITKGAAAGATAGFFMGGGPLAPPLSGGAAGAGAFVGGTGAAVGDAFYCLGGYAIKSAACPAE